jgi:HAD superfamily hydrolase (TIGR01549 family)/HAD superfamily hydrolase (TIGR01509 family)
MTIQAVFFDMGGTVETYWYTAELRLQATPGIAQRLRAAGIDLNLSNADLCRLVTEGLGRHHGWSKQTLLELPAPQIWHDYILKGFSYDPQALDRIAEDLTTYYETHFYHREMRPEVPAVLEAIRGMGLKIGLISNVRSRGQVPFNLDRYQLRHYFDPIVLSSEYGRRKPDPAIFHHAARLANVPTSQCVYVGDRIARDILGARKAGYRLAVQILHDFDHGEEDVGATPDFVIHQMAELLDILKREQHPAPPARLAGSPNPVRAFIFDAGNILYHRPRRGASFKAFLDSLGLQPQDNHAAQNARLVEQAYCGQITQDQFREAVVRLYGVTRPEQIARGKQILQNEDNDVQFYEGVRETLAALKDRGYYLGIITDSAAPVSVKLGWFEQGGFGHVWDSIIASSEFGVRKPDPALYQAALRQLGLEANEAVFVGHKASELSGARQAGLKTVAFNDEPGAQADVYIQHFTELLQAASLYPIDQVTPPAGVSGRPNDIQP